MLNPKHCHIVINVQKLVDLQLGKQSFKFYIPDLIRSTIKEISDRFLFSSCDTEYLVYDKSLQHLISFCSFIIICWLIE